MDTPYKFHNASLEPKMFEELAAALCAGQTISRQNIIKTVEEYHAAQGGLPYRGQDIEDAAKKARTYLVKAGIVQDAPGKGMWKFVASSSPAPVPTPATPAPQTTIRRLPDYPIYGTGKDTVYLFAFEEDIKEDGDYQIKIGKTTGHNQESRIRAQTGTGTYKKIKILLAIRTDIVDLLEISFHTTLKVQGRWIQTNDNKEWFMTRPSQVLDIYNFIEDGKLPPALAAPVAAI